MLIDVEMAFLITVIHILYSMITIMYKTFAVKGQWIKLNFRATRTPKLKLKPHTLENHNHNEHTVITDGHVGIARIAL